MEEEIDRQLSQLESAFESTGATAELFRQEVHQMRSTLAEAGREVQTMTSVLNRGLRGAIDGLVFDGDRLSDSLRKLGKSMVDAAYEAAIKPVTGHFAEILASGMERVIAGTLAFENGASFTQGRVQPFANGGIVNAPTAFPMRGGVGLMGEAGPEAIIPLSRTSDGKLGVRAQGGSTHVNVTMNISTPDAASFARTRTQVAGMLARAIDRGNRTR